MSDFFFEGFEQANTTAVPDVLFDELLVLLNGAELKVMLYIIRRTLGFKKTTDTISFNQFLRGITTKEGRVLDRGCGIKDRTTLSKALARLERLNCIESTKGKNAKEVNEITAYSIKFRSQIVGKAYQGSREIIPPVVGKAYQGSREIPQGVVGKSYPQETVLQDTDKQDTEYVLPSQSETPASVHSAIANAPHTHSSSQSSSEQEQEPEHHEANMSVQPSYSHLQSETTLEEKESEFSNDNHPGTYHRAPEYHHGMAVRLSSNHSPHAVVDRDGTTSPQPQDASKQGVATDDSHDTALLPSSVIVPITHAGVPIAHDTGMDVPVLPVSAVPFTGTATPPVMPASVQASGLEDARLSVQVTTMTTTTKKPARGKKGVPADTLLECPLSKPEMNGTWNDEAVVQYTEYCNGVRYRDTERERQKKAAHAIHLDDTALTCADYQTAYDERNDEWWKTHKGKLHVAHMRGKEGATGIDRLHAMLDRAASRTAGTMDEVTKRRIDIVYDTLNKLKQEVMGDPEARFHRTAQDEAAIVSFLLEQKATPKQVRLAFCDMWNEKNHDGSYRWRKRLTVRTFCQQYESRIMALEGKSPLSASPESASASGKPVVHADALFRENYIQARNQAMQQRKAVR